MTWWDWVDLKKLPGLKSGGVFAGGRLDRDDRRTVELDLHIVGDFHDDGLVLHIRDYSMDAGIGHDRVAGFQRRDELRVLLGFPLLRTNEEEVEDDEDENYLQKFNNDINRNYIVDVHPECVIHNQSEIQTLSIVVRNINNIIIDELHKTLPFLTKFERARILGQRAKQINSGSKPFVEVHPDIIDGYKIAELELEQKKIPFIIRRPLTNGSSEYWKVSDLENISF